MTRAIATADTRELGRRLVTDAPGAMRDCYDAHGPAVRARVARYVPTADVEDVAQQVFCDLWRTRARFDPERSLRAWVMTIARTRAIDHLRRLRQPHISFELLPEATGEDGRDTAAHFDLADDLRSALAGLPDAQRRVLELAYFYDRTQPQIAALLGIPLGTVKTRAARGLCRLGAIIEDRSAGDAPRPSPRPRLRVAPA